MKKSAFLLAIMSLMLIGCNKTPNPEQPHDNDPEITDPDDGGTDNPGGGTEGGTDNPGGGTEGGTDNPGGGTEGGEGEGETQVTYEEKTIHQVYEIGKDYASKRSDAGIYVGNQGVQLNNLKLLACHDAQKSKEIYQGYQYEIALTDGNEIIHVACPSNVYSKVNPYEDKHQIYSLKGKVGYFMNHVAVMCDTEFTWNQDGQDIPFDYENKAQEKTITEIYEMAKKLELNVKGTAFDNQLISFKGRCLAKDINESNVIFANGENIIQVHGPKGIYKNFVKNGNYIIYGTIEVLEHRTSLSFFAKKTIQEPVEFAFNNLETYKAKDFYSIKPAEENDKVMHPTSPEYSNLYLKPFKIKGYMSGYYKGNKVHGVIDDEYTEQFISSMTNAFSANPVVEGQKDLNCYTLAVANENYRGMDNDKYMPDSYDYDGEMLEFTCFMYFWNHEVKNGFPQVYIYDYAPVTPIA